MMVQVVFVLCLVELCHQNELLIMNHDCLQGNQQRLLRGAFLYGCKGPSLAESGSSWGIQQIFGLNRDFRLNLDV